MTSRIILILILATARLSESEIVTTVARFRMMPRFQRLNAMIKQARLAAPDHHIAMLQQQPLQAGRCVASRQTERWPASPARPRQSAPQILFIFILMQRQFCAQDNKRLIKQASGGKLRIAAGGGRRQRQFMKYGRHRRPGLIGYRVDRGVQIAVAIGSPAQRAAVWSWRPTWCTRPA
ncbi:Uncharacterised protein [Klebsiella pneumoniae subsp. rhinoscleromatis]|nr:Uncharacterised protein [Klebsiella pneumoniae subsp. rhinoscleromatis]